MKIDLTVHVSGRTYCTGTDFDETVTISGDVNNREQGAIGATDRAMALMFDLGLRTDHFRALASLLAHPLVMELMLKETRGWTVGDSMDVAMEVTVTADAEEFVIFSNASMMEFDPEDGVAGTVRIAENSPYAMDKTILKIEKGEGDPEDYLAELSLFFPDRINPEDLTDHSATVMLFGQLVQDASFPNIGFGV